MDRYKVNNNLEQVAEIQTEKNKKLKEAVIIGPPSSDFFSYKLKSFTDYKPNYSLDKSLESLVVSGLALEHDGYDPQNSYWGLNLMENARDGQGTVGKYQYILQSTVITNLPKLSSK